LKHSIELPGKDTEILINAAEPVIEALGLAVHYVGDFEQPVLRPMAIKSHRDIITYGADKADEAARAMCVIYKALVEYPKGAYSALDSTRGGTLKQLANPNTT
jgi:hypothetical protein